MGTSKGYNAPTSPQWTNVKREVTRLVRHGRPSPSSVRKIIRDYIIANGGPRGMAGGGGVAGGSKAAQKIAGNLAGFLSSVDSLGFQEALRQVGLESFVGKPVKEIVFSLLDYFGGPASTINDVDARKGLSDLMDELFGDAETEEVEQIMETVSQREELGNVLLKFFGYYLYEQFCRVFYERLVAGVGETRAEEFLDEIRDHICSVLKNETLNQDISKIDWSGEQGKVITDNILQETLEVFTGG